MMYISFVYFNILKEKTLREINLICSSIHHHISCHHVPRHVPSCTDEELDAETCMSADCTIYKYIYICIVY